MSTHNILAGQGRFFRAGTAFTVPTAGTAGQESLPGPTDAGWQSLGQIDLEFAPKVAKEEVYGAPAAKGKRTLMAVLVSQRDLTAKITMHELQKLMFELVFGADITAGTSYSPNSAENFEGWIELKVYDRNNVLVHTSYHYVFMNPPAAMKLDDKHVQCECEAQVLPSTVATALLALTPAAPVCVSIAIGVSGETLAMVFDKPVKFGTGGAGGLVLTPSGAAATPTLESGINTDILVWHLSRVILGTETMTVTYTQPTNGIEAAVDGVDLATITGRTVTNNSTAT